MTGSGVDRRAVALFVAVAFGSAWLVAAPLWLSGRGLATPGAPVLLLVMMLAPSVATVAVLRRRRRADALRATGLTSPGGVRAWWRWGLLAWLGPLVLSLAALALAAAVGVFRVDLVGFSGFAEVLGPALGGQQLPVPVSVLVVLQLVQVLLLGWVNVVPALGEEWGWRGWLLPALLPLGRWPAVLLVGVLWGLWHAPVVLLGYNYPDQPAPLRLLLMVVFCVVAGSLLGWLRLCSDSVWPAAIGHGFVNAAAGAPILFAAAGAPVDTASTGLLGWTGWLVMLAALGVGALVLRSRSRTTATTDPGRSG